MRPSLDPALIKILLDKELLETIRAVHAGEKILEIRNLNDRGWLNAAGISSGLPPYRSNGPNGEIRAQQCSGQSLP